MDKKNWEKSYLQFQPNRIQKVYSNAGQFLGQFAERFAIEGEANSECWAPKSETRNDLHVNWNPSRVDRSSKAVDSDFVNLPE